LIFFWHYTHDAQKFKQQREGVQSMKRILTLMFISIFALTFSIGFVSCKKKPAEEPAVEEKKAEEAKPAAEEKKVEEAKPMKK
jgi:hypothetical protein